MGAVALFFATRTLRDSRAEGRPRIDWGGIVLLSVFLTLLSYPLVEGNSAGWPRWMVVSLIASVPAMALFVFYEFSLQVRARSPLVNLRLFRDRGFALGLVMAMTFFGGLSAFFMGLTIFLQQGLGYGPFATGLVFLGFGFGFVGCSLVSSQLARRIGPRAISVGAALMGTALLGIIGMIHAAHGTPLNVFLMWPVMVWYGSGQGLALPTLVSSVVGSSRIPPQDAGSASGLSHHGAADGILAGRGDDHGPVLFRAGQ